MKINFLIKRGSSEAENDIINQIKLMKTKVESK